LPEPSPNKKKQQVAANPCELLTLSVFEFFSQFAAICRDLYDIPMTADAEL
jgi:hypothetical protein